MDDREERMDEEMRFHLEMEARRNVEAGMSAEEGRRAAALSFGGLEQTKERCREQGRLAWLEDLGRDLRHGARALRKTPAFTAAAVLTVALGIGACAAIFSVVNGVLLRPPPYPDPQRLVLFEETRLGRPPEALATPGRYFDWRREARSFQSIGATTGGGMTMVAGGVPVRLKGLRITIDALPTLGVKPLLGRNFTPDEVPGEQPYQRAALIGHGLWLRQFGGRPEVVGQTIQLDGGAFTVVGVLPRDHGLPDGNGIVDQREMEVFTPLGFSESVRHEYRGNFLKVFGRLAPGVTLAEARNEMAVVAERLARTEPLNRGWGVQLRPLMESVVGKVRPVLLALLGAVGFLLLIACANVAGLLLARAGARSQELALRVALGATRSRVIRQLLVESLLLALVGGALGLVLAKGALVALLALAPEALPRTRDIALDGRALAFTTGLALLTGVAFGLLPALQGSRAQLHDTLKRSARGATRQRLRGLLVVGEVAVALVLLAGAGLLMRSFLGLLAVNPGFDPRHALTVRMNLDDSPDARARPADFVESATARLAALPGVQAVAASARFPLAESPFILPFTILGRPEVTDTERPLSNHYQVSAEYFRAMGIPILRGRAFERTDRDGTARVAVISESLAARFFPGEDPIGKSLQIYGPPCQIVGVVGDVRIDPSSRQLGFQTYQPLAQWSWTKVNFVLRTSGPPESHEAAVRAAVAGLDRRIPVYSVRSFDALVAESIARQRLAMILFAVFSGLALLLAAVGIYGVMAYAVAQRRSEIGVRMALGAQAGNVVGLVFLQAARLLGLGLLLGLLGALVLTRFLEKLLYGVSARDPLTFLGMVGLLAATGAVACLLPARRAARLDPMVALRAE